MHGNTEIIYFVTFYTNSQKCMKCYRGLKMSMCSRASCYACFVFDLLLNVPVNSYGQIVLS